MRAWQWAILGSNHVPGLVLRVICGVWTALRRCEITDLFSLRDHV